MTDEEKQALQDLWLAVRDLLGVMNTSNAGEARYAQTQLDANMTMERTRVIANG